MQMPSSDFTFTHYREVENWRPVPIGANKRHTISPTRYMLTLNWLPLKFVKPPAYFGGRSSGIINL